ncbi:hypothetical protein [Dyadobacter sp. LHD-138]|uniref:hypothetical protein n=1 Tax=Dyadobacter sp. LHD-138 TaxID=3071413 RepID=UPI0027E04240|nr:hypothetical protein [Dyadobacter sp. LHD-138]MDQ6476866.1 hypothetical protein [Dyadobacter sp. LHD-138]
MKIRFLLFLFASISSLTVSMAQVGIGTTTPHASSDLELGTANKALLLNRVANTAAVANPVNGMLIYDISEECVKAYQAGAWSECFGAGTGALTSLSCASATLSQTLAIGGIPYSGTLTVPYTGGNGRAYATQSFTVNGLTATLPAGNFNGTGTGSLVYNIAGTPIRAGSTSFEITMGGRSCSGANAKVLTVDPIASLACASATLTPDQGAIHDSYSGTLTLPYTGGNGDAYAAQSFTVNGLAVTLPAGNFSGTGTGSLVYNIAGIIAGTTSFEVTIGGHTCTGTNAKRLFVGYRVPDISINCASTTLEPNSATAGMPYSGTLTISYTGGYRSAYTAQTFTVNGLTATLPAGNFNQTSGNLAYSIAGTPISTGSTTFEIGIGGSSCTGANAKSLIVLKP